ncbi:hypothetical protein [Methanobrevibacter sp. DSM 116169]|uniref:hypothetical protein n=1 Tax=Methanobrevibacter sp. DSM 116169 TaxID=3242727 RepID=UPI0038FC8B7D
MNNQLLLESRTAKLTKQHEKLTENIKEVWGRAIKTMEELVHKLNLWCRDFSNWLKSMPIRIIANIFPLWNNEEYEKIKMVEKACRIR